MAPSGIADAIGQVHAVMAATHATMLELIAAFDREEAWRGDGEWSMAGWLETALGISYKTAAEWVRTARALENLPAIAAAYLGGRLSAEAVAAVAEVATPETDEALAEEAPGKRVIWLQAAARRARVTAQADTSRQNRRALHCWWEEDWMRLSGRLPAADGAVVAKALERIREGYGPDPGTGLYDPPAALADALVELASTRVANDADADRATVVVHVDAAALAGGQGTAELEDGPALPIEVARRLACDARLEVVPEGPSGRLGVGRVRRQVPAWLGRQLRRRDRGCRFPGCSRTHHLQAHHVKHWAEGGPTDTDNLVLVCGRHHRLVHERGWSITGTPDHGLTFLKPNGQPLRHGPPEMREELRERLGVSWGFAALDPLPIHR
jgi:hypothetical protein